MGGERAAVAGGERAHYLPAERAARPGAHEAAAGEIAVPPRRGGLGAHTRPAYGSPSRHAVWQRISERIAGELARDAARGAVFLCLPVLLAAGAAFYFSLGSEPGAPALALILALLGAAAVPARGRPALLLPLTAAFVFALGVAAAKLETWRASTPMVGSDVTTRVTGRLVRLEHQASGRVRLTIDLLATERPKLRYPPDRVRLTARSAPAGLRPGDGVSGLARLMSPAGPVRPGAYDFAFTSYFRGLGAVGFFMSGPERAEIEAPLPLSVRPARWLEAAREALASRIRTRIGGAEGEMAVAMITGFRAGIPEETNEWLRRSGLAHILAISGLHMALVAVTVMAMLRLGAAFFPAFSSRVPVKKYAAAAALTFCTLYLFISGAAVAAQRSYVMLAVMLVALIFDRAAITMRNVAIAALVIVALSPHEVVGPSFQMSFAATAALVAGYAAWTEWRRGRLGRSPPPSGSLLRRGIRLALAFFLGLAATSLIAGTATALYGVWHFQRATPLGLPANLAAMPLVSLVAMPSAVLAILTMPFGLDGFFLKIMGHAIAGAVAIAHWFSDRSPVDAVGLIPLAALLALTVALVILVVSTTWMRLAALPFAVLGLALIMTRQLPDAAIAEDARLIGLRDPAGLIAVNRSRPNGFTMSDWTRALMAEEVVKPTNVPAHPVPEQAQAGSGFICGEGVCLARHESGAAVAHVEDAAAAAAVCDVAALIVVDDATARGVCGRGEATVVTKRDLARKGAAVVRFIREGAVLRAELAFAIEEPWRPWHAHRAWSRAARGLPPYRYEED